MTVTTVRPNSTDKQTNVGTTGAVAPHTVLSDTSNTTRAQGTVHRGTLWLGIPSTGATVSSSVRLKRARIGLVYAHDGVDIGHTEAVNYRFRDGTSGALGVDTQAHTASSTFPGAGSPLYGPWNTAAPDGGPWTQADIDAAQVVVFWLASVNNQFLFVSEVYVQWETTNQPQVTGVTVTGNLATTRPTVNFTYISDGDPQIRRVARVFSAAQYGAANFNPDTSASAWDSGEVLDDNTTFVIGADLLNTTTYKVWVKAAQAWSGPEGSTWYSAWSVSAPFTITLTPPPTPTLAVTQLLGVPHYRNLVVVSLAGLNQLDADSASFETTLGTWVADSNCTVAQDTTTPKSGTGDMKITITALGNAVARSGSFATSRRIRPGQTAAATISLRAATTGRVFNAGVRYFDVAGVQVGADVYGANATDVTTGYTTATFSGTAPAGSWSYVELVKIVSGAAAEVHRADEAGLTFGSTTWTPGGYFSGVVHLEASQRISKTINRNPARNYVHPQVYSSGALTTLTDGFYPRQANDSVVFRLLDVPPPEAPGDTTAGMIEWIVRVGAFSYLDIGAPDGVPTDGMHPYVFPAVPGIDYTVSTWLRSTPNATARLGIYFTDEYNTVIGSVTLSPVANLTSTFQLVSINAVAPAGTVYARAVVEDTAGAAGISYFLTQTRFRPTATPSDEPWPGQVFAFEWYDVRNGTVPIPQDGRSTVEILDHEAPPDRTVIYSARVVGATPTGQSIASLRSPFVHVYMTQPLYSLLKDTSQPENAFAMVYRQRGDTITLGEDSTELHPAGRDEDPVFGRDWRAGDAGTLTVSLLSELEIYRLQQVLPSDRTVLLQWRTGGQTYARITGSTLVRQRELDVNNPQCVDAYAVATLTYVEQQRP